MYSAQMNSSRSPDRILSVSQLTGNVRSLIEKTYPLVWVTGEISNLARPASGHWYFTLKDNKSQLRCAMFANKNRRLRFKPANGDQVIVRGNLSLYTGRGDFQMIAEHMEAAGEGALRVAFEALKNKLESEGLFREDLKQDFVEYPEHIAIISSATGAALQDVLSVLGRRYPIARVSLLPVLVQGPGSEAEVVTALEAAAEIDADTLILTRGGGSLEDLWTFNLESVVRAVVDCPIPLISAIGHETDVTLTDFAADLRAPTPSVAAELATPDAMDLLRALESTGQTLHRIMQRRLTEHQSALERTSRRLIPPQRVLQQLMQRADQLDTQLRRQTWHRLDTSNERLQGLRRRIAQVTPNHTLARKTDTLAALTARLQRAGRLQLQTAEQRFSSVVRAFNALNPLASLDRGLAYVTAGPASEASPWGSTLNHAHDVKAGDELLAHISDGTIACEVKSVRPHPVDLKTSTHKEQSSQ